MTISLGTYKHHRLDLYLEVKGLAKLLTNSNRYLMQGLRYYDNCFFNTDTGNPYYEGELFYGKNNILWFNALDNESRLPYFWFEDILIVYTKDDNSSCLIVTHPYFIFSEVPGGVHRYNLTT